MEPLQFSKHSGIINLEPSVSYSIHGIYPSNVARILLVEDHIFMTTKSLFFEETKSLVEIRFLKKKITYI